MFKKPQMDDPMIQIWIFLAYNRQQSKWPASDLILNC